MDRSLVSRLWAVSIVAGGLALLVGAAAALRWREVGWGGFVWLAAFFAMMAIRTPYALRTRANAIVESRTDRTDWVLVTGLVVGGFVLPLLFLATPLLQVADYHLPVWATALGTVLQLPALWLMWRSHADLGLNWSPGLEVRTEHELITGGVYARIRHPMYAGLGLWAIGQPLLVHNWIAGVLVIPAWGALCLVRIPREETLMGDRFGSAWDTYAARTGRLLPKLQER